MSGVETRWIGAGLRLAVLQGEGTDQTFVSELRQSLRSEPWRGLVSASFLSSKEVESHQLYGCQFLLGCCGSTEDLDRVDVLASELLELLPEPLVLSGLIAHQGVQPRRSRDERWQRSFVQPPATAQAVLEEVLAQFARVGHPRAVVVDDQADRIEQLDSLIERSARWVVPLRYGAEDFASRHAEATRARRERVLSLCGSAVAGEPTLVNVDLNLAGRRAADEGVAFMTEVLLRDARSLVRPVSTGDPVPESEALFHALGVGFPGRLLAPLGRTDRDLVVSWRSVPPPVAAAPPDAGLSWSWRGRMEELRVAVVTLLGEDFPWRFTGLDLAGHALCFQPQPPSRHAKLERYAEFVPAELVPACAELLFKIEAGRLAERASPTRWGPPWDNDVPNLLPGWLLGPGPGCPVDGSTTPLRELLLRAIEGAPDVSLARDKWLTPWVDHLLTQYAPPVAGGRGDHAAQPLDSFLERFVNTKSLKLEDLKGWWVTPPYPGLAHLLDAGAKVARDWQGVDLVGNAAAKRREGDAAEAWIQALLCWGALECERTRGSKGKGNRDQANKRFHIVLDRIRVTTSSPWRRSGVGRDRGPATDQDLRDLCVQLHSTTKKSDPSPLKPHEQWIVTVLLTSLTVVLL